MWFYFEQTLQYPVSLIGTDQMDQVWLNKYDMVIIPDGDVDQYGKTLMEYVQEGGKVLALQDAIKAFGDKESETSLASGFINAEARERARVEEQGKAETNIDRVVEKSRMALSERVAGSIYKVQLDPSHVLGYGYNNELYLLKNNSHPVPLLPENDQTMNVGVFGDQDHISGFVGKIAEERLANSLAIGVEHLGKGKLLYMSDSPVFRGFWRNGELLMANAVFFF
jgi:hypothetical protein